jgi:hypothetical protein
MWRRLGVYCIRLSVRRAGLAARRAARYKRPGGLGGLSQYGTAKDFRPQYGTADRGLPG